MYFFFNDTATTEIYTLSLHDALPIFKARLRFSYEPPHAIRWVQEKGDTKSLEGGWAFEDLGERTRATYSLAADPGRVLGMLLRGPAEGKVRDFLLGGAAEGLKRHAERG